MRLRMSPLLILIVLAGLSLSACTTQSGMVFTGPNVVSAQEAEMTEMAPEPETFTFDRVPADVAMSTGQSVFNDCQAADANYPYSPYDWPDAGATLELVQKHGMSMVSIEVHDARPNTYYTVWVRLRGTDAQGNTYGGSPLTGGPGTPLIPSSALADAAAALGEGNGRSQEINGFRTDAEGNGSFSTELDYPIINGVFPFQKFESFDPTDERYPADEPRAIPVPIGGGSNAPFTIRVASHCTDDMSHGLVPGPHEGWFDWKFQP